MDISGKTAIVTGTETTVDRPTRETGPKLGVFVLLSETAAEPIVLQRHDRDRSHH
jgi:hypothetical protein